MAEQKALMDPNRKDDSDDDLDEDSDEEYVARHPEYIFVSAIDVGSRFINVTPDDELKFNVVEGNYITQFNINNACPNAYIAFYVYTSAPIPVKIVPNCGFIPA